MAAANLCRVLLHTLTWHTLDTKRSFFIILSAVSCINFFLLKYVLTHAQVIEVFYRHKLKTTINLGKFLRGDNTISARNQRPNLAQFVYENCPRYLNYFCRHFNFLSCSAEIRGCG